MCGGCKGLGFFYVIDIYCLTVISEMLDLVSTLTIKKIPTEDTQKEIINKSNPVITKAENQ